MVTAIPYSKRVWNGEQITFQNTSNGKVFTIKSRRDRVTGLVRGFATVDDGKQSPFRMYTAAQLQDWLDDGIVREVPATV